MFQSRIKQEQICVVSAENGGEEPELEARRCCRQEERGEVCRSREERKGAWR